MSKDKDAPAHMWPYYKGSYTCKTRALEEQYPCLLARRSDLRAALDAIKNAERVLDSIMKDEEEKEDGTV